MTNKNKQNEELGSFSMNNLRATANQRPAVVEEKKSLNVGNLRDTAKIPPAVPATTTTTTPKTETP